MKKQSKKDNPDFVKTNKEEVEETKKDQVQEYYEAESWQFSGCGD